LYDRLAAAFVRDAGYGLLQLGAREVGCALPPTFAWWRDFAARYVTALCAMPEGGEIAVAAPEDAVLEALIADVPPMTGTEYLTPEVLVALWASLDAALHVELSATKQTPITDLSQSLQSGVESGWPGVFQSG